MSDLKTSPYEAIGGDETVKAVCARLYELMEELPEARACREVHPPSLDRAEEKLYEFLSGWLGGPQLYREKYGHPRLRQRHFVAPIGHEEAAGWLACFHQAWNEIVPKSALSQELADKIDQLGWHMQNREAGGGGRGPCTGQNHVDRKEAGCPA